MLLRMYLRYAERKGWKTTLYDIQDGDEAGVKSATFEIEGDLLVWYAEIESGVHRLVRISPFDSNARRHTSFASVFVSPIVDDDIDIEINDSDIKVDTYRASGAGGQHINKTDSAVRMTHMPTELLFNVRLKGHNIKIGISVINYLNPSFMKENLKKDKKIQDEAEGNKSQIAWGSQIRSYVLAPYKLVKDVRTSLENHSPDNVLDGDIEGFINAFLVKNN